MKNVKLLNKTLTLLNVTVNCVLYYTEMSTLMVHEADFADMN